MHEQPRLISLQRSQDDCGRRARVKPTEKCFYLARLSSLLKVRFFRERTRTWLGSRARAKPAADPTPLKLEKKRLWSRVYPLRSHFFPFCLHRPRFPSSLSLSLSSLRELTVGEILGGCRRLAGGGRNCVNYPLISASDPWITGPPRMLIPLSFIERRFRNDTSRFQRSAIHPPASPSERTLRSSR